MVLLEAIYIVYGRNNRTFYYNANKPTLNSQTGCNNHLNTSDRYGNWSPMTYIAGTDSENYCEVAPKHKPSPTAADRVTQ